MNRVTIKYTGIVIGKKKVEGQFSAPENMVGYVNLQNAKPFISLGQTIAVAKEFLTHQYNSDDVSALIDVELLVEGADFLALTPIRLKNGFDTKLPMEDSLTVAMKKKEEPVAVTGISPKERLANLLKISEDERTQKQWNEIKRIRRQMRKQREESEEKETADPDEKQHRAYVARKSEDRAYADFVAKGGRR